MSSISVPPAPAALLHSLRGLGYTPETAIADLIDNSIAAGARRVEIDMDWRDGKPVVSLLDDGRGMTDAELVEAMRFGGTGPLHARNDGDLGRFGLGLKTASLSQCRRLVVVTKRGGHTSMLAWDIDEVEQRADWCADVPPDLPDLAFARKLAASAQGTLVVWDRVDTPGLLVPGRPAFNERVVDVRDHLGMTFGRFIGPPRSCLHVRLNDREIPAWDPFAATNGARTPMPRDRFRYDGTMIVVTPVVLPHHDRFATEQDYDAVGGPGGWAERQGFYVYRGDRLLVAGGWLGIGTTGPRGRSDADRLVRIAVDIPTSLDAKWRIDIRKSIARPPAEVRAQLARTAHAARTKAREVVAWRSGGRPAVGGPVTETDVWLMSTRGKAGLFLLNREHPAIVAAAGALGAEAGLLEAVLRFAELAVPVERIRVLDDDADHGNIVLDAEEVDRVATIVAQLLDEGPDGDMEQRVSDLLRPLRLDHDALRLAVMSRLRGRG